MHFQFDLGMHSGGVESGVNNGRLVASCLVREDLERNVYGADRSVNSGVSMSSRGPREIYSSLPLADYPNLGFRAISSLTAMQSARLCL